jgi:predicted Zn-dependent protease with MMP-like domain
MNDAEREAFDALVEEAIEQLPDHVRELLEEVPVVVLDRPTAEMLRDLGMDPNDETEADELCGLHTGTANTERSVERADLPSNIHLFRNGIISLAQDQLREDAAEAGGAEPDLTWHGPNANPDAEDAVFQEIWVTLLHEIGHEFGLDEDDLERLGYD